MKKLKSQDDFYICSYKKIIFMELMDISKDDKLIYQHNVITSGRYDYSACMLDILFMVLSCLEKDKLEYTIQGSAHEK